MKEGISDEKRERQRTASRRWRERHPERNKESHAKYREANREKRREECRKWRTENPEKGKQACHRWREENPEKVKQAVTTWQQANPEKVAEYQRNRRDKKYALGEKWRGLSASENRLIHAQFENKCFHCGSAKRLALDHHLPLSAGFPLALGNAVLLCGSCNSKKRDTFPEDFYSFEELQYLNKLLKELNTNFLVGHPLPSNFAVLYRCKGALRSCCLLTATISTNIKVY